MEEYSIRSSDLVLLKVPRFKRLRAETEYSKRLFLYDKDRSENKMSLSLPRMMSLW